MLNNLVTMTSITNFSWKPLMKVATWNVNSVRVRWPHIADWLTQHQPDVLCLQELKCEALQFPWEDLRSLGYVGLVAGQKAYNGVALLSREPGIGEEVGLAEFPDPQQRVIAATFQGIRVVSVYCPNGESLNSDKYQYKLAWFDALQRYIQRALVQYPRLVIAGDFNIAPHDQDIHDPKAWAGEVLCSPPEREKFAALLSLGLTDCFRQVKPLETEAFTWWHYRVNAFKRNMGLRIDHILVSDGLSARVRDCQIDRDPRGRERPSDHAPVIAEFQV